MDVYIAFFNDSVTGIAPNCEKLKDYAEQIGIELEQSTNQMLVELNESGYVRANAHQAALICDVAPIGPDYQPGHGHADTLSFELSLFDKRIFVNSGIDRYEVGEERERQRGTSAHNTIEVDGQNSSEVWNSFRVARRARPFDQAVIDTDEYIQVECKHDGYKRLLDKVIHSRKWILSNSKLEITDVLEGKYGQAISRLHLHTDVLVEQNYDSGCKLVAEGNKIELDVTGGILSVIDSTYHPRFNLSQKNKCLVIESTERDCTVNISW